MKKTEIHLMYKAINNKDDSFKDFTDFVDFMFEHKDSLTELPDADRQNFTYHFNKIPSYTRDALGKIRHELIKKSQDISIEANRMVEKLDSYTQL